MKLCTEDQFYGWLATTDQYDGPGSPIGSGKTEREAVDGLLEMLEGDESFAEFVGSIRAERIARGLSPDTGKSTVNQGAKHERT